MGRRIPQTLRARPATLLVPMVLFLLFRISKSLVNGPGSRMGPPTFRKLPEGLCGHPSDPGRLVGSRKAREGVTSQVAVIVKALYGPTCSDVVYRCSRGLRLMHSPTATYSKNQLGPSDKPAGPVRPLPQGPQSSWRPTLIQPAPCHI